MKNLLLILLSGLFLFSCNEEEPKEMESGFDTFYELHENDDDVLTIGMPVFLFKMFVDTGSKGTDDALDKVKSIDLFIKEGSDEAFNKDLKKHLSSKKYKTFLSINEKDAKVRFLLKEKGEKIDEIVIVVEEQMKNNSVILRIDGSFDIKNIENLAEKIDISGIAKYR